MAEETSLARQLKKLAVPQTNLLIQSKIRASLLFDPREASSLDRDTIFAYGSTGLDKLLLIEPSFSKFEQTLFSASSKTFERSVQNASTNSKLDTKIGEFLTMLSPYFSLRGAHEALEWLIYRFHIHLYNIDALIACILPHYHTRIFVRVIQLLDLTNASSRWYWLHPVQKSGKPLELSILLNQFNSDAGFRKFLCELVPNIIKVYSEQESTVLTVVSFSTVSVYYAFEKCKVISDSSVTSLFPYLIKGLKSGIASYCAGTYIIISLLMTKVKLATKVLEELLIKISQNLMPSLMKPGLETILLIFQQQNIKILPKEVLAVFCSTNNIIANLQFLTANYLSSKFIRCIIKSAIPVAFKEELSNKSKKKGKKLEFICNVVNNVELDEPNVNICFSSTLNWYTKLYKSRKTDEQQLKKLKRTGRSLLKCLESKWPAYFDRAIQCFFKKEKWKENKCAWKLLNCSVNSFQHKMLPDSGVTLFLGINHANSSIRCQATKTFLSQVLQKTITDVEFVENSLLKLLCDDCSDIVNHILSEQQVLIDTLPQNKLFSALNSILMRNSKKKSGWHHAKLKALNIICIQYSETEGTLQLELLELIMPFLFPLCKEHLSSFSCILNSPLGESHPIMKVIKEDCLEFISLTKEMNNENLNNLNYRMFKALEKSVSLLDQNSKMELVSYFMRTTPDSNTENCKILFRVFLLQHLISAESSYDQKHHWIVYMIEFLKTLVNSDKLSIDQYESKMELQSVVTACASTLRKKQLPLSVICFALQKLIQNFQLKLRPSQSVQWWPSSQEETQYAKSFKVLLALISFLLEQINKSKYVKLSNFQILLGVLLKQHLPNVRDLFWFLSSVWSNNPLNASSTTLQIASMKMANSFCIESKGPYDWFFDSTSAEFPALLVAIGSEKEQLRSTALQLLHNLLLCCEQSDHPFRLLGEKLCHHAEEIKIDSNQLFHVISTWLTPAFESRKELDSNIKQSPNLSSTCSVELRVLHNLLRLATEKATPCHVRRSLLFVLQLADSTEMLSEFLPLLKHYLTLSVSCEEHQLQKLQLDIIQLLVKKFSPQSASKLTDKSEEFDVLLRILQPTENTLDARVQQMALKQITKEFFITILSTTVQQNILDVLVNLYINSNSSEISLIVGKILRKLCVYAYLLLKELQKFLSNAPKNATLREVKKSKTQQLTTLPATELLEKGPWKKITVILEIIQNKKRIDKNELLVPELFNLLNKTLDWESQPSVEYLRQLILSSIFNCCEQLGVGGLDERKFQVELVVQCIRASENPKTHHQSLLLLNLAATMFPDYVLNNVMSIFTFMGSSLVRQDDSYSFQVISQTIETIIPALQQASNQQQQSDTLQVMATVIRVFVDSLQDIPRHRQLPLFTKLITTLGPSEYLWIPLGQICERYASSFYDISGNESKDYETSPTLEFAIQLHKQFSPGVQLDTCLSLIKLLVTLSESSDDKTYMPALETENLRTNKEPFNLKTHSDKQLQIYKYNVLSYINLWLSSPAFVSQLSEMETKSHNMMEVQYEALLEVTLKYLQHECNALSHINSSKTNCPDYTNLLPLLYDLLNNINSLLPCKLFIRVIKKLLSNSMLVVQQKAIEMLNAKLEHQHNFFTQENYNSLLKLLRPLLNIIKKNGTSDGEVNNKIKENNVLNQQTALFSLHLLCKIIGHKYPLKFHKVLTVVVGILHTDRTMYKLIVNALLCLAELCSCLNAHVLPHLNLFMPEVLRLLDDSILLENYEYLAVGVVTALQGLIENLGAFLSSYMVPILTNVCILVAKNTEIGSKKLLQQKLQTVCSLLATEIPPRVLLPAIENSYSEILMKRKTAVSALVSILGNRIQKIDYADINAYSSQLQKFYLLVLDFRSQNDNELSSTVEIVEGNIIHSLMTLIMKLSEPSVRSCFHAIYQWATSAGNSNERILTFYRLTYELGKNLKNLFVLFAAYIVRHAASMFDSNNIVKTKTLLFGSDSKSIDKSKQLLIYIIDTLDFCFQYDDGQLLDKECFNALMQPLVDQLENELGGDKAYQDRIENHLTRCLAQFMASLSDNALWKPYNYQILLKTRHSSPKVRFAALQVIGEIVKKMGDNYLALLPESIPFLAEIMEDESLEVEQQCQTVIGDMEKILGEPIRKYF